MCIRDSSGVRGLNAILATVTTNAAAPVIVAQRLRKGSCGSPRGAKRLVTDALATVRKLRTGPGAPKVLLRADSAFYGHGPVGAAVRAQQDLGSSRAGAQFPDRGQRVGDQAFG